MSVLSSLAGRTTTLSAREVDHLHRLLGDWQLLADLAFADLLLLRRSSTARPSSFWRRYGPIPLRRCTPRTWSAPSSTRATARRLLSRSGSAASFARAIP